MEMETEEDRGTERQLLLRSVYTTNCYFTSILNSFTKIIVITEIREAEETSDGLPCYCYIPGGMPDEKSLKLEIMSPLRLCQLNIKNKKYYQALPAYWRPVESWASFYSWQELARQYFIILNIQSASRVN